MVEELKQQPYGAKRKRKAEKTLRIYTDKRTLEQRFVDLCAYIDKYYVTFEKTTKTLFDLDNVTIISFCITLIQKENDYQQTISFVIKNKGGNNITLEIIDTVHTNKYYRSNINPFERLKGNGTIQNPASSYTYTTSKLYCIRNWNSSWSKEMKTDSNDYNCYLPYSSLIASDYVKLVFNSNFDPLGENETLNTFSFGNDVFKKYIQSKTKKDFVKLIGLNVPKHLLTVLKPQYYHWLIDIGKSNIDRLNDYASKYLKLNDGSLKLSLSEIICYGKDYEIGNGLVDVTIVFDLNSYLLNCQEVGVEPNFNWYSQRGLHKAMYTVERIKFEQYANTTYGVEVNEQINNDEHQFLVSLVNKFVNNYNSDVSNLTKLSVKMTPLNSIELLWQQKMKAHNCVFSYSKDLFEGTLLFFETVVNDVICTAGIVPEAITNENVRIPFTIFQAQVNGKNEQHWNTQNVLKSAIDYYYSKLLDENAQCIAKLYVKEESTYNVVKSLPRENISVHTI